MSNNQGTLICTLACWAVAVLAGLLGAVLLMLLGDWRLIQALFAAVVIIIILGALLSWIVCKPLPGPQDTAFAKGPSTHPVPTSKQSAAAAAAAAREGAAEPAPVSAPAAAAAEARALVTPSKELPGQTDLAARKGTWKYEPEGAEASAPKASEPAPAPAPEPTASAAAASEDYDGDGVVEGENEGTRPEALDGPRGGKADNLKEIKGIGPKLEKLCNSLGFYHFDQIAGWTADEVAWVNANLQGFKGRVTRDEWVAQAKILASGGETEFSKRVDDGDVY